MVLFWPLINAGSGPLPSNTKSREWPRRIARIKMKATQGQRGFWSERGVQTNTKCWDPWRLGCWRHPAGIRWLGSRSPFKSSWSDGALDFLAVLASATAWIFCVCPRCWQPQQREQQWQQGREQQQGDSTGKLSKYMHINTNNQTQNSMNNYKHQDDTNDGIVVMMVMVIVSDWWWWSYHMIYKEIKCI